MNSSFTRTYYQHYWHTQLFENKMKTSNKDLFSSNENSRIFIKIPGLFKKTRYLKIQLLFKDCRSRFQEHFKACANPVTKKKVCLIHVILNRVNKKNLIICLNLGQCLISVFLPPSSSDQRLLVGVLLEAGEFSQLKTTK
jgi:hypothetical protein